MQAAISNERAIGRPPYPGANRDTVAVAFADIVGYSALMATDEARTYAAWMDLLARLVRPEAEREGGRIVQVMGDGVLAEFPNAGSALAWAEAVQQGAAARPAFAADDTPLSFRIAIHCGAVTRNGGDIFGDAVNTAARLQEHADPGGILLSEAALSDLGQLEAPPARDLGHLALKNIERPVRAFALGEAAPRVRVPSAAETAELPSIAVLPFVNRGDDTGEAYFADGIVEDVIISLSGLRELLVIARGSTLGARNQGGSVPEIGRALGVRYTLSGSVARAGGRVRVVCELAEIERNNIIWAERFEAPIDQVFEVQDRIVARIVAGIAPQVRSAELQRALRKRPGSITAYDHWLRAIDLMGRLDRASFFGARTMLERALAADPRFAMGTAWFAHWHSFVLGQGWSENAPADSERAVDLARHAVALDPRNAFALAIHAQIRAFRFFEPDAALREFDQALAICPNLAIAWMYASSAHAYLGHGAEAVRFAEQAMRLSPLDQWQFHFSVFLGIAHYANGDYAQAARWGALSAGQNPHYTATPKLLAAANAALGRMDEARVAVARLLALEPGLRLGTYIRNRQPFRDPRLAERYEHHLRLAGVPDQ